MKRAILAKHIENEMKNGDYHKVKTYKPPITAQEIIEKVYKKQVPDRKGHLEIETSVLTNKPRLLKKVAKNIEKVEDKVEDIAKKVDVSPEKKGGDMKFRKLVVEGSTPVTDISAKQPYFPLTGSSSAAGRPSALQRRSAVVKKIMKEKGMSLIEASKYVKAEGIPY